MILSKSHDGLVAIGEGRFLDVLPFDGSRIGGDEAFHPEEEQLAFGQCVKYVGVMVEDGIK